MLEKEYEAWQAETAPLIIFCRAKSAPLLSEVFWWKHPVKSDPVCTDHNTQPSPGAGILGLLLECYNFCDSESSCILLVWPWVGMVARSYSGGR